MSTKRIGYVFQDATLLPWRSVQRNVELLAELNGKSKEERRRSAAEAIELVGLTGFEKSLPKQLSGGMRMRTSLARSLTLDPELFLFDEPFGALDEITRERLNDELLRLFVEQQFAGLFITHSVSEAVYLSTKVVVMSGRPGRIVQHASTCRSRCRATPDIRYTRGVRRARRRGLARAPRRAPLMVINVTVLEPAAPAPRRTSADRVAAPGASASARAPGGSRRSCFVALVGVGYLIAWIFALQGRGFLWPYPHEVLYAAVARARRRRARSTRRSSTPRSSRSPASPAPWCSASPRPRSWSRRGGSSGRSSRTR